MECDKKSVEAGRGSYVETIKVLDWKQGTKLKIGNYCSFAPGVSVFLGGEHALDWVTTYPFNFTCAPIAEHIQGNCMSKGDVIIGNDVWVGMGACILSGVSIGDGAVIGAKAVVAKDVPPYAIVVGNPGKIIKYRFDAETIQRLLAIAWWNWPDERILSSMDLLLSNEIENFLKHNEEINRGF